MHESKPAKSHPPSSSLPFATPTLDMVPLAEPTSYIDSDIGDDNAVNDSPLSIDDVPSPVRTTDNPEVTMGDKTADPHSEIPTPTSFYSVCFSC
uniref:Envelope-like protein n=1 Tax=Cucumis melo TaxID=3656 RepID=A0A9I9DVC0_CUCME